MIYQFFIIDRFKGIAHFVYEEKRQQEISQFISGLITALNHISEYIFKESFQTLEFRERKMVISSNQKYSRNLIAVALVDKVDNPIAVSKIARKLIEVFVSKGFYKKHEFSTEFKKIAENYIKSRTILKARDIPSLILNAILIPMIILPVSFVYFKSNFPLDILSVVLALGGLLLAGFCGGNKELVLKISLFISPIIAIIFILLCPFYEIRYPAVEISTTITYITAVTMMSSILNFIGANFAEENFLFKR